MLLDKIINLLKWPIAILALLSLPAFFQSMYYFDFKGLKFVSLIGGIVMFFTTSNLMDSSVKTSMQIIAHELTHSFFAVLTFHKVKHIRVAEDNSGGSMGFIGEGNWLIVIAPYFFPLFCLFLMLGIGSYINREEVLKLGISSYTNQEEVNWVVHAVFGYFIGYHIDTVFSQIHEKQTDLIKVGYPFCCAFLPGANMWIIGSMLAFNSNGWETFWLYQRLIGELNMRNLAYVCNLILG